MILPIILRMKLLLLILQINEGKDHALNSAGKFLRQKVAPQRSKGLSQSLLIKRNLTTEEELLYYFLLELSKLNTEKDLNLAFVSFR